ncbi:site-specific DNA-methyltransferase [Neopusillimonas maritima]|uniref:site-specific DNA-methyltransferase (adenine-specific) n=1 Tax=Neopusillimonas maritima TaxID=2026239 RepID=A0A3A1YXF7_9BURK|nr:site-specific DNA-methyltransferase [Neopusillimonas maritima]RIY41164.1 site-specific DNA-methyltransferase [Neopusillimonas maritima]
MTQPSPRKDKTAKLLARLDTLTPQELKRYLAQELTRKKLGLVWESDLIERDQALNSNLVFPALNEDASELNEQGVSGNLIIEGDNFDALRLLKTTHAGKIRVIYIDPPYNTGNKDWVYNDHYVKKDDRWKHSLWLEFMYQRLCLARDLLAQDGALLISINDENRSRLELLMDEVMPGRRLGSMVWRTRQGSNDTKQGHLSVDHEHILIYANSDFSFKGFEKSYEMYDNPDDDPRGDWRIDNITCSKDYKARPNLYYPLVDPVTGIHYPPNPDSTWRYSSEKNLRPGQRLQTKTMEEFIRLGQIAFPNNNQKVVTWNSMQELEEAIKQGDVPKSGRKALLRMDLPNLHWWVGVPVGFGRPQFKRYKADLKNSHQPISSWIVPTFEEDEYEAPLSFVSTTNHEGASGIADIFGSRLFNYAKPAQLIRNLLKQASRPNDIVLDFFAGSGTTGHAVLALNAEDGGNRKFILCSSTEATSKDPDKNLCRDVCAERIRRVINGYGKTPGLGGDFSYLNLDLIEEADLMFEAKAEHAYALLCLRETGVMRSIPKDGSIWPVDNYEGAATVVCPVLNEQTISELQSLKAQRLVVYIDRPDSLIDMWEKAGHASGNLQAYGLETALRWGQLSREHIAGVDEISHFIDDAMEPAQKEQA